MNFDEVIRGRRSIRRYTQQDITDDTLAELIDLSRNAPSSLNGQPCHFFIIRNINIKRKLIAIKNHYCPPEKISYNADFMLSAPVVVVIGGECDRAFDRGMESGILAAYTLMLASWSRGIGSVFLTAYQPPPSLLSTEIMECINAPDKVNPIAIIPLGYPDELPPEKILRPLPDIIHCAYYQE